MPGTDAALLLAVAQVLFAEDLVDLGTVADRIDGVDDVRRARGRLARPSAWPT